MAIYYLIAIFLYDLLAAIIFFVSLYQTHWKKNAYGDTPWLFFMGSFIWGDALIFSFFWVMISSLTIFLNDPLFFLLVISIFWTIRSFGQTIWCFDIQFGSHEGYPPHRFFLYKIYHDDSIYFVHQMIWQSLTVVTIIATIFLANKWLFS